MVGGQRGGLEGWWVKKNEVPKRKKKIVDSRRSAKTGTSLAKGVAVNPSPRQVTESKKETTHRYDTDHCCIRDRPASMTEEDPLVNWGDEFGGSRKEEKKGKKEEGRV